MKTFASAEFILRLQIKKTVLRFSGGVIISVILSAAIIMIFMSSGFFVSSCFFSDEKPTVKLMISLAFGIILMMWLPAMPSFIMGFTKTSQYIGIILSLLIIGVSVFKLIKNKQSIFAKPHINLLNEKVLILTLTPIFAFTVYLMHSHYIPATKNGGLGCGQGTFGDINLHLSLITSISTQKIFPPVYTLFAGGTKIGYYFLCDSISSTLYTITGDLRASYIIPLLPALAGFLLSVFLLFQLLHKNSQKTDIKASLSTILFLVGGGLGFAYFFDLLKLNPSSISDIFTGFYTTPTNYTIKNIRWVNTLADIIIPQRATLLGWSVLFPCIYILYRATFENKKEYLFPLGILGGALPLISTHSFLSLFILSSVYFIHAFIHAPDDENVFKSLKHWIIYAAVAGALAVPQLFLITFNQVFGGSFIKQHFNWSNSMDNYFWFYIKNIGLIYLLIIPAFVNSDKQWKWFYSGGLAILLLAEFIVFQPNEYDNNKLIFIWFLFTCGLTSGYCVDIFFAIKNAGIKAAGFIAAIFIIITNTGGLLSLGRESVSGMELYNASHVEAAQFINENIPADALFLTSNNHNNTVACLTGRTILCGSASFLFFAGLEYEVYEALERELFINPTIEKLVKNEIDYVYISDYEKNNFVGMDISFFEEYLHPVYRNETVTIYAVSNAAESAKSADNDTAMLL